MSNPDIMTIDVHTLKKLREANPALLLLDVRESQEWKQIHIPDAIHIPKDQIIDRISSVTNDKTVPVYIHCRSGVRSLYAAQCLQEMGFEKIYSVEGGIMDWVMAGYEVIEA